MRCPAGFNQSQEVKKQKIRSFWRFRESDRFFYFCVVRTAQTGGRSNHSRRSDMAYSIKKVDVWAGEIADRPGGLASTLAAMQSAGSNIEFVVARRAPDKPGTGVVFLTPIKGAKQKAAAQQAGLSTSEGLHSVCVDGFDWAGLGAKMADALAAAGINLRGVSAAAIGRRAVSYLAFDSAADADNAVRILKKALK
jgi:hypothetical protein